MMKLWRWYRKNDRIFTNIFFFLAMAMLVISGLLFAANKKNPDGDYVLKYLGYQPVLIQTGSMEPTMRTHSIAVAKRVDSMKEISQGDIITYRVYDETGKSITITHRIYNIKDDGTIITKGDNNRVADSYNITIDNVKAKIVFTWNGAATIYNLLIPPTPLGIAMCVVFFLVIGLFWYAGHCLYEYLDDKYGINDDVEDSVNDRLLAEYEDDDDEEEDDNERPRKAGGSDRTQVQGPQLLDEDRNSWQRIYNYSVSDDNLITITGIKPNFASLSELTVPAEIKQKKVIGIGQFAFKNSVATIIKLPDTLEFIEKAAFYHCEKLIYVELPNNVKRIGENAFEGCRAMIDIKLPIHLTRIEGRMLSGCLSLNAITINDEVTFIGDSAFYGCDNLMTIYGGKNINTIKLNAFKVTRPVETNIITKNTYLKKYDWSLFGRNATIVNNAELLRELDEENQRLLIEYDNKQEEMRIREAEQVTSKIEQKLIQAKNGWDNIKGQIADKTSKLGKKESKKPVKPEFNLNLEPVQEPVVEDKDVEDMFVKPKADKPKKKAKPTIDLEKDETVYEPDDVNRLFNPEDTNC
ncbi:MAG: signal peptidase I [Acutalibacteraceae bacterium]|nr:signal peptidase I [Acutalibacteraceae bacterium]